MIICERKDCVYNVGIACKAPNISISVGGYCQRYFARSNLHPDPPAYHKYLK